MVYFLGKLEIISKLITSGVVEISFSVVAAGVVTLISFLFNPFKPNNPLKTFTPNFGIILKFWGVVREEKRKRKASIENHFRVLSNSLKSNYEVQENIRYQIQTWFQKSSQHPQLDAFYKKLLGMQTERQQIFIEYSEKILNHLSKIHSEVKLKAESDCKEFISTKMEKIETTKGNVTKLLNGIKEINDRI